jgi:hypothetical protein
VRQRTERASSQIAQTRDYPNSPYTAEEVGVALSILALHCGNARKASKALKAAGRPIPETTLKHWRTKSYVERYRQIEAEELPKRYARIAERSEAITDQAADLEEQLIEQLREQAAELPAREVSNALRNASVRSSRRVSSALAQVAQLRGQPRGSQHDRNLSPSNVRGSAGDVSHPCDRRAREVEADLGMLAQELSEPPDRRPLEALIALLLHQQAEPQRVLEVQVSALPGRFTGEL